MEVSREGLEFEGLEEFYSGKVRDVYFFGEEMAVVVSDRISAFDHILPRLIPYKGQVLNLIAAHFLEASRDIVPIWLKNVAHPNVSIGHQCSPIRLEMVVRGYMAGHAWRTYRDGGRTLCGVNLPEGMIEADRFEKPIITPATKAVEGHDEDISAEEILNRKIVSPELWEEMCQVSLHLFERGSAMAREQGLLLVDTKYEFGLLEGKLMLIDEIHTPDSSRYYIADGYQERQASGEKQEQLSKEFVREWLIDHNFQGLDGQEMPEMDDDFVNLVSERYIDLYERITGKTFPKRVTNQQDIKESISQYFKTSTSED